MAVVQELCMIVMQSNTFIIRAQKYTQLEERGITIMTLEPGYWRSFPAVIYGS